MASHFRLGKCQIWDQGVMTANDTITSDTLHILNLDNINIQLNVTGDASGAFEVQVSSDHQEDQEGNVLVEGEWVAVPLSQSTDPDGDDLVLVIDLNQLGAPWLRIQYTNDSGDSVVDGFASGKGLM